MVCISVLLIGETKAGGLPVGAGSFVESDDIFVLHIFFFQCQVLSEDCEGCISHNL